MIINLKNKLSQTRFRKQLFMVFTDIILLYTSIWLAFTLRLGTGYWPQEEVFYLVLGMPLIAIPVFIRFGLYRAIVRYIGFQALWSIIQAVSLYGLLWASIVLLSGVTAVPRSVSLINWLVCILLIGGSRMAARWWLMSDMTDRRSRYPGERKKVVIYGAGSAGAQLATALSISREYQPVAFIDDSQDVIHQHVASLRVYPIEKLEYLIRAKQVDDVFIAIPSLPSEDRKRIIESLESYSVHVKTLPSLPDIADGKVRLEDVQEIDLVDLLGRSSVEPNEDLFDACIKSKSVMVTGAGGSIGSELCRQIVRREANTLVLYEHSEYMLYQLEKELASVIQKNDLDVVIVPILGSILNYSLVSSIVENYSVQTIYHAAAYKHVPLVEANMLAGARNNIMGTMTVARAARDHSVEAMVLISTDKAVRPTNVMGATKRFAELILQAFALTETKTRFCMVRFGNVLGSSGSVVPLFREQIRSGGPVSVTHQDIIRYFMTIPEAAQLVIQAGSMGTGGDVFVLDMGEPVKIKNLAEKMIKLMGRSIKDENNPEGDIEIVYSGLRPGEKLYEELLIGDNVSGTRHPLIMRAEEEYYGYSEMEQYLGQLKEILHQADCEKLRKLLLDVVVGYKPTCDIEDTLWKIKSSENESEKVILLSERSGKSTA